MLAVLGGGKCDTRLSAAPTDVHAAELACSVVYSKHDREAQYVALVAGKEARLAVESASTSSPNWQEMSGVRAPSLQPAALWRVAIFVVCAPAAFCQKHGLLRAASRR